MRKLLTFNVLCFIVAAVAAVFAIDSKGEITRQELQDWARQAIVEQCVSLGETKENCSAGLKQVEGIAVDKCLRANNSNQQCLDMLFNRHIYIAELSCNELIRTRSKGVEQFQVPKFCVLYIQKLKSMSQGSK